MTRRKREEPPPAVRLTAFDWTAFITANFVTLVLASLLVSSVGVVLIDPTKVDSTLRFNVALSVLCSFLVFIRVWKSVREEHETATSWLDTVGGTASKGMGRLNVLDARLEVLYVFTLMFLPFSVVSFHTLVLCLGSFYVIHALYMRYRVAAFSRKPTTIDRLLLIRFFVNRARLDALAAGILVTGWVSFAALQFLAGATWATNLGGIPVLGVAFIPVVVLIGLELFVDSRRLMGIHFVAGGAPAKKPVRGESAFLWLVPRGAAKDSLLYGPALQSMCLEEFAELANGDERTATIEAAGRRDNALLLVTDEADTCHLLGYVYLRKSSRSGKAGAVDVETAFGPGVDAAFIADVDRQVQDIALDLWPRLKLTDPASGRSAS